MTEATSTSQTNYVELAADIVSAYVSNNSVPVDQVPGLLRDLHTSIVSIVTGGTTAAAPVVERAAPAVAVKKSITPDYLICLEDGKKFKSLKRHLRTAYNMSPEDYRAKWGLNADYPMVAPNYASQRSELAKKMGLGQQRSRAAAAPNAAKKRGGRKAATAAA